MTYGKKTPLLGIPVPNYGDKIHPETEFRKACIIENMLIAGVAGVKNSVFDDGSYRIERETDETSLVRLSATGASPSAEGIVSGAYFKAPSVLVWKGLENSFVHYLYIRAESRVYEDHTAVRVFSSKKRIQQGGLLMAVVDLVGESPKLDTNPDGKIYSADLARHVNDIENPHGRRVYQDELVITERLILMKDGPGQPSVRIETEDGVTEFPASAFAGAIGELAGKRVEIVDFKSGGRAGVVLKVNSIEGFDSKLFYVQTQRLGMSDQLLGEVGVGYFGMDDKVDEKLEFAVYNTGEAGIEMRAIVYIG